MKRRAEHAAADAKFEAAWTEWDERSAAGWEAKREPASHWLLEVAVEPLECLCGRVVPAGVPVLRPVAAGALRCVVCAVDGVRGAWWVDNFVAFDGGLTHWVGDAYPWHEPLQRMRQMLYARLGTWSDPTPTCPVCSARKMPETGQKQCYSCGRAADQARERAARRAGQVVVGTRF